MRFCLSSWRLPFSLLAVHWLAGWLIAADSMFVGKLALLEDPEVAKELGLADDTKAKLKELINNREKEAIDKVAKLKGQPQAKQIEAMAPFAAESEKLGMALLTDAQIAKLDKMRVAKEGMLGVLGPDMSGKLQLTDDQKKEIGPLVEDYKGVMARGNEMQKRTARGYYEKKIASLLTDAQRGSWEQLSGTPAGGSAAPTGGGATSGGATSGSGSGGVNVQRAAGELTVTEDGKFKFTFIFTPWRTVLEYFAKQGGYAFATDKWPSGTFNYTDPRPYTAEQAIDLLNMHLLTKGFILVKREKLLRLFDTANDGSVPPEFVPEIGPEDLANRGEFELVTVTYQLDRWPATEAEGQIKKRLGPYGSITVFETARQLAVTELGGRQRWIKRMIDAVEQPNAPKDEKFGVIRLNRLTPTEFMNHVRQLYGIAPDKFETDDKSLRLSPNELDSVVYCFGKGPKIEQAQELARQIDGNAPGARGGSGGLGFTIAEQPQFKVYTIWRADPVMVENVIRTLLANSAPELRVQRDEKSNRINVLAKGLQHQAIAAIINEMENEAGSVEVIKLRRKDALAAATDIIKLFGGDPNGKTPTNSLKISADQANQTITINATLPMLEQIKDWLIKEGEPLGGPGGGRLAFNSPEERTKVRILPMTSRQWKGIMNQLDYMWDSGRAKISFEGGNGEVSADPLGGRESLQPRSVTRGGPPATAPKKDAEKLKENSVPRNEAKPAPMPMHGIPQPNERAIPFPKKDDVTFRTLPDGSRTFFVSSEPVINSGAAVDTTSQSTTAADSAPARQDEQPQAPQNQNTQPSSGQQASPGSTENAPAEIHVRVTPAGIIISSNDLDALDEFQTLLQSLVENYDKGGKRMEVYYLKYAKSDTAVVLVQEMLTGGANLNADNGNVMGALAENMFGGMGGLMGQMFSGGGGNQTVGGTVTSSSSGSAVTITSDPRLNALYVSAMPRDLDTVEQFLQLIDQEASPDPPQAMRPRFIPVKHGRAADVAEIVKQVYAGKIMGDQTNRPQINPQDLIMAAMQRGLGGGGGRGGFGGGGRGGQQQQQNRGEEPKMTVAVATDSNSLVVTAPEYLFNEVKAFVEAMDFQNVDPDQTMRVVSLRKANSDTAYTQLMATLPGAQITRVYPPSAQPTPGARGAMPNAPLANNNQQGNRGQGGQFNNPALLGQLNQFNQGQGNRGGQNNFGRGGGGPGGFGQGGFGGQPGGFGGNRGGGPGGGGNFGGGNRGGGPGGGGGGNPFGGGGGGNRGGGGGPGGGGAPGGGGRGGGGPGGGGFQ
jgi:type II secretory pathway component GspD/PulD (secretin)